MTARHTANSLFLSNAVSAAQWPNGSAGEIPTSVTAATGNKFMDSIFRGFISKNWQSARAKANVRWAESTGETDRSTV